MKNQIHSFQMDSHLEGGFFCGYASVFDVVDHHREVIAPEAFTKSLKRWQQRRQWPKLLWQHDMTKPIGFWKCLRVDQTGLYVEGQLLLDIQQAREAYTLLKSGVLDGLSIGFRPIQSRRDARVNARVIEEVDLLEISLVTFAANPAAKVTAVKERTHAPHGAGVLQHLIECLRSCEREGSMP